MPVPFVLVDDLEHPEIGRDDRHHLERVLRLRTGDPVELTDGRGGRRSARLGAVVEVTGPVEHTPRPVPPITVAFCPVKGDRPDWAVQKLTELGVDRIVPLMAERSVVRWDGPRIPPAVERWRRIAREALTQCRRTWMPEIAEPLRVSAAIGLGPVAFATAGGGRPSLSRPTVLIGPEGGWTDDELALAPATVELGPHVLRTETAAVTAGAIFSAMRAGIVNAPS